MTDQTSSASLSVSELKHIVVSALEDFKALDIQTIDVSGRSPLADFLVIASGSSSRHVKSMSENLVIKLKSVDWPPLGVEGDRDAEWVLVDLNDIIVHLMLPQTRAFYNLEKLWEAAEDRRAGNTVTSTV